MNYKNIQDNIYAESFDYVAEGINNWIEENKKQYEWAKDPNAYELTNVFLFAGKYQSEGQNINIDNIKKMWELRSNDFERCGIGENHFVYQICKQSYDSAINGEGLVDDEKSHSALRKMAGIGLYLMQQKRENKIDYNNYGEFIELIDNSQQLKTKYPKLHDRFRFSDNIRVLYDLQLKHLNPEQKKKLDEVYNAYMQGRVAGDDEIEV